MNRPVTQDWVHGLSLMQQSVLLTAIRGPDGMPKYHASKYLLRWYRRCVLLSSFLGEVVSNPYESDGGSFLGPSIDMDQESFTKDGEDGPLDWRPKMDDLVTVYIKDLDSVPHHFHMHLMHAAEIVGYKHPKPVVRRWWLRVYERFVRDMHLWPESEQELDRRLGDSRDQWLARSDPATTE